jgi:diaminopropionate ammonia-lyase
MGIKRWSLNPNAHRRATTSEERRIVSLQSATQALVEIRRWSGYAPTPLRDLGALAAQLGVHEIHYKDESTRFALGSFKALGGAYGAARQVQRMLRQRNGQDVSISELFTGRHAREIQDITLCCATDGNHGVSVAFAARRMNCRCTIFMHERASKARENLMLDLGATVHRTPGTYDDSVRIARKAVGNPGWVLIADTTVETFEQVPAEVIQGYTVMLLEVLDQDPDTLPTHVFVQGGVGGLAAAVAGFLAERFGEHRPTVIIVEPETAACLLASSNAGRASRIEGNLHTIMGMLECGEASSIAWTILKQRADAFITIDDETAVQTHAFLTQGNAGETLDVGYSGAAGVAGLMAAITDPELAAALRLDKASRILTFGTEMGDGGRESNLTRTAKPQHENKLKGE